MLACLARKESALSTPQDPTPAQVSTVSCTMHASTETALQVTDDSFSRRGLELSLKPRQWVPLIQCLPKSASCEGTLRKSFAFKYPGYLVQAVLGSKLCIGLRQLLLLFTGCNAFGWIGM